MNKTDMSNPGQYAAYLRAYVAQRRQDKLRHASRMKEWRRVEVRLRRRGGARKPTQVKIYRSAVSCDRARML